MADVPVLAFSLLTEPFIRYRRASDGELIPATLPQILAALVADDVRDFPALRPHQRHVWHAFLVSVGVIALHQAKRANPFVTPTEWCEALLALTPDDADGAAWCLVSPPERPAFLQAAVPDGSLAKWSSRSLMADEIDMLITSRNHDIKGARAIHAAPDDWLFALLSLQHQEGYLGAGNYGISRMNSGYGNRPGVGVAPVGLIGKRWLRDVTTLLVQRSQIAKAAGLKISGGIALVWTVPWDGQLSLPFASLDPFYIEICRRVRLQWVNGRIEALGTTSKAKRILADQLLGATGDAWTPVEVESGKALTVKGTGFDYRLVSELLFGAKYRRAAAHSVVRPANGESLVFHMRAMPRGESKTEGYHERHVPISPKAASLLAANQGDVLARLSAYRITAIGEVRKHLWAALVLFFSNPKEGSGDANDTIKARASRFSAPFEQAEDSRFFVDLYAELEAADATAARMQWLLDLVARAEQVMKNTFAAAPCASLRRYQVQSSAQSRFYWGTRSAYATIPELANFYQQRKIEQNQEKLNG
jgi:CRISPR system Cascade subunit CasA